ncbi:MAG: ComEC/Rec2 family competence protein [Candidatus Peregrinibacteria bacterium]|nr:ComEC/Rec2 family competence protein [Candidatus Peregrinibacteria bacterium]
MLLFLNKTWRIWGLYLLAGYAALAVLIWQLPDDKFHMYFLNIGQGDSTLIITPENHQILIDGGPKNYVLQQLDQVMPFFDKTIDLVVITHPHADHIDGLVEVLKRYEVNAILMTGVDYKSPSYDEFLKVAAEKNIQTYIAKNDEDFIFGAITLDVIYPDKSMLGKKFINLNNSSIVMKVLYAGKTILMTGDMAFEEEDALMKTGLNLKADILKVGHHGSKTSSSQEFLNLVKPEIAIIQSGKGNSFGHPSKESLERLKAAGVQQIYRNDTDGRIEITF